MKSILKGRRLILGSKSPRRSKLLKEMDIPYLRKVRDTDESFPAEMPVFEVAEFIAKKKADVLLESAKPDDIVLTADSVVIVDDKIYGKPKNKTQAKQMLEVLSGNVHHVVTGVCICSPSKTVSFSETAEVKISSLRPKEIKYYVDNYIPIDKAGAYGIQEWIGHAKIEWIRGTYPNIMGLPTKKVYDALSEF